MAWKGAWGIPVFALMADLASLGVGSGIPSGEAGPFEPCGSQEGIEPADVQKLQHEVGRFADNDPAVRDAAQRELGRLLDSDAKIKWLEHFSRTSEDEVKARIRQAIDAYRWKLRGPMGKVAYAARDGESGPWRIVVRFLDSDAAVRDILMKDGEEVEDLLWSPDGARLVGTRSWTRPLKNIGVVVREGFILDDPVALRRAAGVSRFAFAPDGRILSWSADESRRRFVMDADGRNPRPLPIPEEAIFTPDGKRILFGASDGPGEAATRLMIAEPDGKNAKRVLELPAGIVGLTVSGDGTRMAALSGSDRGPWSLHFAEMESKAPPRLLTKLVECGRLAIDDDGARVAVCGTIFDTVTGTAAEIPDSHHITFLPDRKRILLSRSNGPQGMGLYVMHLESRDTTFVGRSTFSLWTHGGCDRQPAYCPPKPRPK